MCYRFTDLRCKEVINISTGCRLGRVDDVEIDSQSAKIQTLIIFGRPKFFGLFGREDDILVEWCNIKMIGEDTILISNMCVRKHRSNRLGVLFGPNEGVDA